MGESPAVSTFFEGYQRHSTMGSGIIDAKDFIMECCETFSPCEKPLRSYLRDDTMHLCCLTRHKSGGFPGGATSWPLLSDLWGARTSVYSVYRARSFDVVHCTLPRPRKFSLGSPVCLKPLLISLRVALEAVATFPLMSIAVCLGVIH